jgi:hypothetical protein
MEIVKDVESVSEETVELVQPEAGKELYNGVDFSALDTESFEKIKNLEATLNEMLADTAADLKLTEAERDEKFGAMQGMIKTYSDIVRASKFNIGMNSEEYSHFKSILTTKIEYGSDNILTAVDINNKYFKKMPKLSSTERSPVKFLSTDLLAVYMFILKHTVVGLGRPALLYANLLIALGVAVNIYNYFDQSATALQAKIANWAAGLEEEVTEDDADVAETVTETAE